jgi:hypothetical protein
MEQNQNNPDSDPMEQQLEAYAQNRRKELENEPIALDEATRTMLQGEVKRVYPEKSAQRPATVESGMPAWLPWVMGGAVCALALVVSLDFNSGSKATNPMEIAKADPKSPKPIPAGEDSKLEGRDISTESAATSSRALTVPSVDKESADATALNEPKKVSPPQPMPVPRRIVALKAAPEAIVVEMSNRRAVRYNNLADLAQNFVQEPAGKSAPKAKQLPEPILVDFQIERKGNLVKVMDRDGSVYTGNVINEEKFTMPAAAKPRLSAAASASGQRGRAPKRAEAGGLAPATIAPDKPATPAPKPVRAARGDVRESSMAVRPVEGQFFFRVQGTNQTLQRLVVFEATLDGMPGQTSKWQYQRVLRQPLRSRRAELQNNLKSTEEIEEHSRKAEIQRVQAVQLLRVQGNARIGKANYRLDAFQTPSSSYRPSVNSKADSPTPRK